MYISSDGTRKDVKTLDTSYLINALAKQYRVIWESLTIEQCKIHFNNIGCLKEEIDNRVNLFVIEKFGGNN